MALQEVGLIIIIIIIIIINKWCAINQNSTYVNFTGKRACPGEVLAMQEMFLILSALVQQFDILPPEGETSIRDEINFIQVLSPAKFEVRFMPRAWTMTFEASPSRLQLVAKLTFLALEDWQPKYIPFC